MKINFRNQAGRAAIASALMIGSAFIGANSYAGTATGNMAVSASIAANCTISASPLAFGAYDQIVVNASTDLDTTTTVATTCTTGSSAMITLSEGANKGSSSTAALPVRQLTNGTDLLAYSLYSDSGRTTAWGNTAVAAPTGTGGAETTTVYARIPAGQKKPVGSYADTVVATVTF